MKIFQALLKLLPRGHQKLMRLYARILGHGDYFWGMYNNLWWRVDVDDLFVSGGVFRLGYREPAVTAIMLSLLHEKGTFVDAGANKGYFTLLAGQNIGCDGHILAFEPLPENKKVLQENLTRNGFDIVRIYEVALWDKEEWLSFQLPSNGTTGDGRISNNGTLSVASTTLDQILESENLSSVDVMKVDVEGAELHVLKGSKGALSQGAVKNFIIEVHTGILTSEEFNDLFALLDTHGYECRRILTEKDDVAAKSLHLGVDISKYWVPYDPDKPWDESWAPTFWWQYREFAG